MESILSVQDLHITFSMDGSQTEVVHGVSFDLMRDEILCIVGESGSGKSVTAKSILKLLPEESAGYPAGSIIYKGEDILSSDNRRMNKIRGSEISMIFQDPLTSLNPVYRIGSQMTDLLRLHHEGMDKKTAMEKAAGLLKDVEITETERVLNSYPFQLSGGMRQRVMIAMAISSDPGIIIADEPTTALDVTIQAQILKLLVRLHREKHMSIIFITHDLSVVYEIADRILVFNNGNIVEAGTRDEIFYSPKKAYTRKLLNSMMRV